MAAPELFGNYQKNIRSWGSAFATSPSPPSMGAIAVAEENAAAGRIVTAPTQGSAGISIPATLRMLGSRFRPPERRIYEGLLVAGHRSNCRPKRRSPAPKWAGEVGVASARLPPQSTALKEPPLSPNTPPKSLSSITSD